MDVDAFLEIFNTLYAVDLTGGDAATAAAAAGPMNASKKTNLPTATSSLPPGAAAEAGRGSREGRCQGSWEGEGCGGRRETNAPYDLELSWLPPRCSEQA